MTRHVVFFFFVLLFCVMTFGEECDCGDGADLSHCKLCPSRENDVGVGASEHFLLAVIEGKYRKVAATSVICWYE